MSSKKKVICEQKIIKYKESYFLMVFDVKCKSVSLKINTNLQKSKLLKKK